jgi:hypothetical protein
MRKYLTLVTMLGLAYSSQSFAQSFSDTCSELPADEVVTKEFNEFFVAAKKVTDRAIERLEANPSCFGKRAGELKQLLSDDYASLVSKYSVLTTAESLCTRTSCFLQHGSDFPGQATFFEQKYRKRIREAERRARKNCGLLKGLGRDFDKSFIDINNLHPVVVCTEPGEVSPILGTQAEILLGSVDYIANADRDGDGLSSTEEAIFGLNPLKADTDSDGLNDYNDDADLDGSPNGRELAQRTNGIDANSPVVNGDNDTDGDGYQNGLEFSMGVPATVAEVPSNGRTNDFDWLDLPPAEVVSAKFSGIAPSGSFIEVTIGTLVERAVVGSSGKWMVTFNLSEQEAGVLEIKTLVTTPIDPTISRAYKVDMPFSKRVVEEPLM